MRATLSNPASSWRPGPNGDSLALSPSPIPRPVAGNFNSTGIVGIRSRGSSAQNGMQLAGGQILQHSHTPSLRLAGVEDENEGTKSVWLAPESIRHREALQRKSTV